MTNEVFIAKQAKEIAELKESNESLLTAIKKAKMHIYCIGGPLNDNRLGYSRAQMVTFARIAEELEAV